MTDLLTNFTFTDQSGTETTINDVQKVSISLGSEIKNNSMNITLQNPVKNVFSDGSFQHEWVNDDKTSKFRAIKATRGTVINEELIDVYSLYTDTDPTQTVKDSNNLLFNGIITKGTVKYSVDKHTIELYCQDRNVVALSKLTIPQAYKAEDNDKSPTIVKDIIRNGSENALSTAKSFDSNGNLLTGTGSFLIDARLFSEGVKSSGTTTSTSSNKLIDSGATFITDGVAKDDWVRNSTDETYAYVASVDSETQLTLRGDIIVSGETYEVSDGFIQDTRPDGTAFPDTSFSQIDKPITESIQSLSQTDKTNSTTEVSTGLIIKRGMRWFIDKQNRFHWYVPGDTPQHIIEVGTQSAISPDTTKHIIHDVELKQEVDDNINFIVFRAGRNIDNVMIRSYARAPFSGTPITKESLRNWLNIALDMKEQDKVAGNLTLSSRDEYTITGSFPFVPAWDSQERSASTTAVYKSNFVEEAKIRGVVKAQAIFQKQANPRWSGTIQLRGEDIIVGDLVQFTSKAHGIVNIKLRVIGVTQSIDASTGWITSISVEEDENELEVIA